MGAHAKGCFAKRAALFAIRARAEIFRPRSLIRPHQRKFQHRKMAYPTGCF
jgi:hypothetical protein